MTELLPVIDFVPSHGHDSIPVRPPPISSYGSGRVSTSSRVAVEAQLFSDSSIRPSLDLEEGRLKEGRIFAIIAVLTGVQFLSSLSNGFLTVGLPRMASDLSLPDHLLLWPSGVY